MNSALYVGHVVHARHRPVRRAFRYRVFMWWLDLDELPRVAGRLSILGRHPLFGSGGGHLFDVQARDHLGDPARSIADNVRAFLGTEGITTPVARVMLLTHARLGGHVFNPISLLYCHGEDDSLIAVVVEVHNTYGELHCYVVPGDAVARHSVDKVFYVSPFLDVRGRYALTVPPPDARLGVAVALEQDGAEIFHASLTGRRREITRGTVARLLFTHPLLTLRVSLLIRWQALRIWARGVRVVPRTPPASRRS